MEELIDNILNEEKMSSDEYRYHLRNSTLHRLQKDFNFEIVEFLGEGSYGDVVAVNSPNHEETVALKIIRSDDTWAGELLTWPALDHKNILPLLEFIKLPCVDLFITPIMYNDMETLLADEEFVYDQDFLDVAKKWLREVLGALDYLHSQKLCHLDIKADNVLIDYGLEAVLCDFSFLSSSDELLARYGVPFPYRPPETCLADEECILVDGIKFDMWSYGIMVLNVFTGHFLRTRIHVDMKWWHKDIYPLLYEAMQITYFRYLMSRAFPVSTTEDEFSEAFNLVQYILRIQPEDRPSVQDVVNHIFFGNGYNRIEKPDDIWIFQEKVDCPCNQPMKTSVPHRDNFEMYKYRNAFKRIRMQYKRIRKWEKPSTMMKREKHVPKSALRVLEKFKDANKEQCNGQICTMKTQGTDDSSVEFRIFGDMVYSHADDKNIEVEAHYDEGVSQPFGATGDDVNVTQNSSLDKNTKCNGNDIKVNVVCRTTEELITNKEFEKQALTELTLPVISERFVNIAVDTEDTFSLTNFSDKSEEESPKKDLSTWLKEKLCMCTVGIRNIIMSHKSMKENPPDSPLSRV